MVLARGVQKDGRLKEGREGEQGREAGREGRKQEEPYNA
jgi:hypothetical protein